MHNQAKKPDTEENGRTKPYKSVRKRDFRVGPKGKRKAIPDIQRERVRQKHIEGKKMRAIAREEKIHVTSVAKIIKEADIPRHIQRMRERFYGRLEEAMEEAFKFIHENAKEGGKQAYAMIKDAGVVGEQASKIDIRPPIEMESEEQAVHRIALSLLKGTVEKHKFFGLPLPEADEIEEEIKKADQEKVDTDV